MSFSALYDHKIYKQSSKICLLCNQTSYDFDRKSYLFDLIADEGKLHRLLLPEHGLFSEMQDQENVDDFHHRGVQCFSLYDKKRNKTGPEKYMVEGSDLIVIDIFDVGVRYFTYCTHMFRLLKVLDANFPEIPIVVIDRPNPIGNKTEGTIIQDEYASFLGVSGMIHRHGMSVVQLCQWYISKQDLSCQIIDVPYSARFAHFIMPSPNLPSVDTLSVYPGQCFWEATTLSEGRGTTRPFEIFGHPELTMVQAEYIAKMFNDDFSECEFLRPIKFIPSFHKHKDTLCVGWQLFIENVMQYHSIFGTLTMMRMINEMLGSETFWRKGAYEFDSQATAAQLLLGDDDLIAYVNGQKSVQEVKQKLQESEKAWSNVSR
jgi:uncharacterized protein YbbC (DUF1343 family)